MRVSSSSRESPPRVPACSRSRRPPRARASAGARAGALALAALFAGCSVIAPAPPPPTIPAAAAPPPAAPATAAAGASIAAFAATLVGTPYHFGGADAQGFDCSGLALYVHERLGIAIPRTAAEQQREAQPVALADLQPGDLVFFRLGSQHVNHVGVYTGDGLFVHAPHAGVAVSSADLRVGYYARHLASAGRYWSVAATAR
jgi:cell wall-associated NlpC family hydrolase